MAEKINVMVSGLPGNMATKAAEHVLKQEDMELLPIALAGKRCKIGDTVKIGTLEVVLYRLAQHEKALTLARNMYEKFVIVDYTHPNAVNDNASFYCDNGIPFVMGTTGGDRALLVDTVNKSDVVAVIAPNMAKQIVAFQAMMEYAAETFPKVFKGYHLEIKESHQAGKADTSGTAKAMAGYFNKLGIPFTKDQIAMERDPVEQQLRWKVPLNHISGHGWHTYTLESKDGTVFFQFTHNVNGRDIYGQGTLDAIRFLNQVVNSTAPAPKGQGVMFDMIDVLSGSILLS